MNNRKRTVIGAALCLGGVWTASLTRAEDTLQQRFDRLEQRYNILERKVELDQEAAATKAKDGASVTASAGDGFTIRNADKSFSLKFAGYTQGDARFYLRDRSKALTDTFIVRRARLWLDLTLFKVASFRVVPDFGGGTTALQDAYLNLNYHPAFQVRAGRFKVPFGLERLQASDKTLFIETAHTTSLTPNYDNGLQLWGDLWDGALTYAAAYTNGPADGASVDGDSGDAKALSARVFAHPFRSGGSLAWKDLGVGFAVTKDQLLGAATATVTGLSAYRTPGQQSVFAYLTGNTGVVADGERVRWSPQAYWYPGRFGVLAEYVASQAKVKRIAAPFTRAKLTNEAWQVQGSFVLTGETASYRGVKPRKNFDTADGGGWGAWELAGRYSELKTDPASFAVVPGGPTTGLYANSTTQVRRASTISGGVNWYLNNAVKIQAEYDHTRFTGGALLPLTRRPNVREFLTRFQFSF